MLTVITETTVKPGREADWDAAYYERAADAQAQDGWVELQLLVPLEDRRRRVVVGTWRDQAAWQQWHATETFQATRERLDDATEHHGEDRWFEVVKEERTDMGIEPSIEDAPSSSHGGPETDSDD